MTPGGPDWPNFPDKGPNLLFLCPQPPSTSPGSVSLGITRFSTGQCGNYFENLLSLWGCNSALSTGSTGHNSPGMSPTPGGFMCGPLMWLFLLVRANEKRNVSFSPWSSPDWTTRFVEPSFLNKPPALYGFFTLRWKTFMGFLENL
jgi:hypothetical protein